MTFGQIVEDRHFITFIEQLLDANASIVPAPPVTKMVLMVRACYFGD
jgi:hypothetical protein